MKLFLLENKDKSQGDQKQYVYITDFDRFMYSEIKHKERKYFLIN